VLYKTICGVVLAGGKSRRMGMDKAFIPLGGRTLIKRVTDVLAGIFSEVVIVACADLKQQPPSLSPRCEDLEDPYADLPHRILKDQISGLGPMGGIETALKSLSGKGLFVVAADMPFLNPEVIQSMLAYSEEYDLVIPVLSGRLHPLHAFYAPQCLPAVEKAIRHKQLAVHLLSEEVNSYLFPEAAFRNLDPELHSIVNINTPEGLVEAQERLSTRTHGS
jgi:molybdenum cofactor guanylyltransferase